ncbi:autophagy- protein 2, partial [Coemansia spiralis]
EPPSIRRRRRRNSGSGSGGASSASGNASPGVAAGSAGDQSEGIEYKVVEFRTLQKLLDIRGLRLSISPGGQPAAQDPDTAEFTTIMSAFGAPITAHARIHRRMPFSEVAPVPRSAAAGGRRSSGGDESVYMGPMPGAFREARPAAEPTSPEQPTSGRTRNNVGEDPATSGWDVSCSVGDLASVVSREQLAQIIAIAQAAAPVVKRYAERQAVRDQYRERFGDTGAPPQPPDLLPQLAKWISLNCKHIYVAVIPQPGDTLAGWHDSSLAVLRLKLEKVKHLALYLKELTARWESTPPAAGTASAPTETAGFMETDFWAAMTREAAVRADSPWRARGTGAPASQSTVTVSAGLQSFSLYDNCPEHHPVVLPLVSIDRSLGTGGAGGRSATRSPGERPATYDIWVHTSGADRVLTVYVAPIVIVLNKALVDRLAVYLALVRSVLPSAAAAGTAQQPTHPPAACFSDLGAGRDVADSIERLMGNLKLETEQRMPSNVAVCSPLIRTWIMLPGTAASDDAHSGRGSAPARSRGKAEAAAPGHFCIDAVDAVITNVVNGTATSSQSPTSVPEGHMRHPHVQELLESRKSVGGSGVRVECEALRVHVQTVDGGDAVEHVASVHEPSRVARTAIESASIPRPHIEITAVSAGGGQGTDGTSHWPPAFDAFAAVDDNIRVRMAPESELTTTLEFERQAVASSRMVVSCHLPESDISLSQATYQRLNAVINDFLLWQSVQEEAQAREPESDGPSDARGLAVSVLVDMPLMTACILGGDAGSCASSQRVWLNSTQLFLSNALVERGRIYVSAESNQLRLSSFADGRETEVVLSHTFATPEAPMITPQLSLFLLTAPSIAEESAIVLKTTWTTFDYTSNSACFRELEAFFSSSGTSGMVQPPPKPMRLSLNVQNSSFRWAPTGDPSLSSAVISLDRLAVIVGLNLPVPERDSEELHYYVEGLSVFGRSADAPPFSAVDVSSDAWVSTGRFWRDHAFSALLHMDMVDLASKSREGDDGPLADLRLYSEALVVNACADSVAALPSLLQGLLRDVTGSAGEDDARAAERRQRRRRSSGPRTLEQQSDDIFGDVDEDTFGVAASFGSANMSAHSIDGQRSFTRDFEEGLDDIDILTLDDYFAVQEPADVVDEYEVVGGQALSPTSPVHPSYTRREPASGARRYTGVPIQPAQGSRQPPALSLRNSGASAGSRRHSLDSRHSNSVATDQDAVLFVGAGGDLAFSDVSEDESSIDLGDYAGLSGGSDMGSDADDDAFVQPRQQRRRSLRLQSRFAGDPAAARDSVVLEPDVPASRFAAQRPVDVHPPRAKFIDMPFDASGVQVKVTVPDDAVSGQFIGGSSDAQEPPSRVGGSEGFGIIDDYFGAPGPDEAPADEGGSSAPDEGAVLSLTIDAARVEVRLYAGQDWFAPAEPTPPPPAADDLGIIPSYMDALDDAEDSMAEHGYARTSASLPDDRGFYGSTLGSPQKPQPAPRTGRRSAAPKIRLRATQVHSEFRQFAAASATAYELGLNVDALEILDELESSEWSKFLTRRRDAKTGLPATLHSLANARNRQLLTAGTGDSDRVTGSRMHRQRSDKWPEGNAEPMICIQIESVRPYAGLPTEELRMDAEISPLRCYIHQDALDFMIGFFEAAEQHAVAQPRPGDGGDSEHGARTRGRWTQRGTTRPYFQIVRIAPINVIFDYKPRRMRAATAAPARVPSGSAATSPTAATKGARPAAESPAHRPMELLNLFPLEDAEMTLHMVKARGVAGVSKLVRELGRTWLPHLTQTQIPSVVSGVAPLRSLVNFGAGVADLVILPLEQYRRDGRLVQGIRRGAQSFAKTTALEAIQLGAKVAVNAQTLLEQAGDILNVDIASSGDSGSASHSHESRRESLLSPWDADGGTSFGLPAWPSEHHGTVVELEGWPDSVSVGGPSSSNAGTGRRGVFSRSKYARQPENLSEGMRQAYSSLRSNVGGAVQTILAIPVVVQEDAAASDGADAAAGRTPVHGSVRAVVRAVPVAVLKPMIGATEAVSKTLLGLRNTMEPGRRGQLEDKYKARSLGSKRQ